MHDSLSGILARLMSILALAGFVAYVPGTALAVYERLWPVAIADTVGYAMILVAALKFRNRPLAGLGFIVAASLIIGVVLVLETGPFGAGYLWLLGGVVIASLLPSRYMWSGLLAVSLGVHIVWAFLASRADTGIAPQVVFIIAASFLVVALLVVHIVRTLVRRLAAASAESGALARALTLELEEASRIRAELERTTALQGVLVRELQHRVRNNLQMVHSLMDMEEHDGDTGRPQRLLQVLIGVNDVLLEHEGTGRVGVWDIIRAAVDGEGPVSIEGAELDGVVIERGDAVVLALVIHEMVHAAGRIGTRFSVHSRLDGASLVFGLRYLNAESDDANIAARAVSAGINVLGVVGLTMHGSRVEHVPEDTSKGSGASVLVYCRLPAWRV